MWSKSALEKLEAVQKVLGEPVAVGFTNRTWRARTQQLLSVSLVGIGTTNSKLSINPNATVLSFDLTGLTDQAPRGALVLATVYLLMYFDWMAWEIFLEWRMRLTEPA